MRSRLLNITIMFTALIICKGAEALSVDEIVTKANIASYYQGDDGKAQVNMTITDKQGRERHRDFVILRKDKKDGKKQLFYVFFKSPSDVRKTVFMVWKNPGADDDRWMYLPALDLVKRIAASDKRSSFVGSDFLYEDVSGRSINDDLHILEGEEENYYIIKNTPLKPDTVEFSYYKVWINKKTFMPEKAEYFKENEKLYRSVKALEIKEIDGFPTIIKSQVSNYETESVTTLVFSDIQYNLSLDDNIFTERFLRRPPREVR